MEKLYVQATLKFRTTKGYQRFCEVMTAQRANLESEGWRMVGAWVTVIGRVATVLHLWEVEDANHYVEVTTRMRQGPEFEAFREVTGQYLEEEFLSLLRLTPYSPAIGAGAVRDHG